MLEQVYILTKTISKYFYFIIYNFKLSTSNQAVNDKKSTIHEKQSSNSNQLCTVVKPRSSSSSSLQRTPIFVAPKKAATKTVAFGLTTNIEETVEVCFLFYKFSYKNFIYLEISISSDY